MLLRPKGDAVEIISDGKVLYTLDLSREPDREIVVEYEGRKNIIAVEDGDIYMKEADCPDHTCMKTGRLSRAGVPIVCLPNHLMIRYKNSGGDDVDAAAG
ncbi:MAG: NusG domain II-containing protein [Ruminococcus sp.]|nr:NusG domain II-containing protein [Ruminococcus sp.]